VLLISSVGRSSNRIIALCLRFASLCGPWFFRCFHTCGWKCGRASSLQKKNLAPAIQVPKHLFQRCFGTWSNLQRHRLVMQKPKVASAAKQKQHVMCALTSLIGWWEWHPPCKETCSSIARRMLASGLTWSNFW